MLSLWELRDKEKRLVPRVKEIHSRNIALNSEMNKLGAELKKIQSECEHLGTLTQSDDDYVFSRGEASGQAYFCAGCGKHWVKYYR